MYAYVATQTATQGADHERMEDRRRSGAWNEKEERLKDRSRSPWDAESRRPSHADKRNALRRTMIEQSLIDALVENEKRRQSIFVPEIHGLCRSIGRWFFGKYRQKAIGVLRT